MKTERNKAREERKEILFDEHELDQEAYEQQCLYDILHEKTVPENERYKDPKMVYLKTLTETYSNLDDYYNDLHIEVLSSLYRCEIKLGQELQVIHNQAARLMLKQGFQTESEASTEMNSTVSSKLSRKYTKNMNKARKEFKELQKAYKETGKVPLNMPMVFDFEKKILLENFKNPYLN